MGVLHQHHRRLSSATALALLLFAFASSSSSSSSSSYTSATAHSALSPIRQLGGVVKEEREESWERLLTGRRLAGPGSSPPTCRTKCGKCSPCKAVHVPIQPGWSTPLEYYPEAWRCKCDRKHGECNF
ncbi:EPIDERMAL PATTERNING FACTOR-like protein 4 [Macadamia integrifolia]|uniref:EPIDERMAL PATTERNING FACTOR-like protein 4 n=1 Tax=Macadamia integrifolia TaxID=60698 RepID=UPI001C4E42AC|nr:EPIDERMAL PATTERNING FACTOR-like protein 4 [Macadamia integrifolia]